MIKHILLLFLILGYVTIYSQHYDDYLGAGHDRGIKVWSSSNEGSAIAANTVNGEGLDAMKIEASRFLAQAAFGGSEDQIQELLDLDNDFNAWLEDQFSKEVSWMLPKLWEVNDKAETYIIIKSMTPLKLDKKTSNTLAPILCILSILGGNTWLKKMTNYDNELLMP